ncbi:MAG: hypothetical protein ACREBB_04730 [Nitrosotalea sp.]
MTIFVSSDGKAPKQLEKQDIEKESMLQEYIYKTPKSIIIDELKPNTKSLLIVAREFENIDHLGIDTRGNIYLIETKREEDSTKRRVVAQVLDYGSKLWSLYGDAPDKFEKDIDEFVLEHPEYHDNETQYLRQRLKNYLGKDDDKEVSKLIDSLQNNLRNGAFSYFVVMDQLAEDLKDLLRFLRNKIHLDIYGVEMEYYKDEKYEVMIPRIFGEEIRVPSTSGTDWSKEDFEKAVETIPDQATRDAITKLMSFTKEMNPNWKVNWNEYFGGKGRDPNFYGFLPKFPKSKYPFFVQGNRGSLLINLVELKENPTLMDNYLNKCKEKQLGFITSNICNKDRTPKDFFWVKEKDWVPRVDDFISVLKEVFS